MDHGEQDEKSALNRKDGQKDIINRYFGGIYTDVGIGRLVFVDVGNEGWDDVDDLHYMSDNALVQSVDYASVDR